jgi:hypothetical protein
VPTTAATPTAARIRVRLTKSWSVRTAPRFLYLRAARRERGPTRRGAATKPSALPLPGVGIRAALPSLVHGGSFLLPQLRRFIVGGLAALAASPVRANFTPSPEMAPNGACSNKRLPSWKTRTMVARIFPAERPFAVRPRRSPRRRTRPRRLVVGSDRPQRLAYVGPARIKQVRQPCRRRSGTGRC